MDAVAALLGVVTAAALSRGAQLPASTAELEGAVCLWLALELLAAFASLELLEPLALAPSPRRPPLRWIAATSGRATAAAAAVTGIVL